MKAFQAVKSFQNIKFQISLRISFTILAIFILFVTHGQNADCPCTKYKIHGSSYTTELKFTNNPTRFNPESLNNWTDQEKCDKIKSLTLVDFDTIPKEFKRFRNVEKLNIQAVNNRNLFGLDSFEKLKELVIVMGELIITDSSKWITRIERLTTNKTVIKGLKSFSSLKNLQELKMSFSGFDPFPKDLSQLKKLRYLSFGGHTFGVIDLNQIDLLLFQQLEYFEIQCWSRIIIGVPKGLSNRVCIKIQYDGMTMQDKQKLIKLTCH